MACSLRWNQSSMARRCLRRCRALFRHMSWHQPRTCQQQECSFQGIQHTCCPRAFTGNQKEGMAVQAALQQVCLQAKHDLCVQRQSILKYSWQ